MASATLLEAHDIGAGHQVIAQAVALGGRHRGVIDVRHDAACILASTSSAVQYSRSAFWAISRADTATPQALTALEGAIDHVLLLLQELQSVVGGGHVGNFDVVLDAGLAAIFLAESMLTSFWVAAGHV